MGLEAQTTVLAWEAAVNAGTIGPLLELSDSQIEIVGPQGIAHGHAILSEWLAHAGLSLETQRSFGLDNVIVNEQKGVWRNIETGNVTSEAVLASQYRVTAGKVSYVARYDSLKIALEKAGLNESNELHR